MNDILKKFFEKFSVSQTHDEVFKLNTGQLDNKLDIKFIFGVGTENLKFDNLFKILQFLEENPDVLRSIKVKIENLDFELMKYFVKNFNGVFEYKNSFDSRLDLTIQNPKFSYDDYGSEFVYHSDTLHIFSNGSDYVFINNTSSFEKLNEELKKVNHILSAIPKADNLFYPVINIKPDETEFKSSYKFSSKKVIIRDNMVLGIENNKVVKITIYDIDSILDIVNYKDFETNDMLEINYIISDDLSLLFKFSSDLVEVSSSYFSYIIDKNGKLKLSDTKIYVEKKGLYSVISPDSIFSIKIVLKVVNEFLSINNTQFLESKLYNLFKLIKKSFDDYFTDFSDVEEIFTKKELF